MENAFNFPVVSPPAPPSIKDEPAMLELPTATPTEIGQQFCAYRATYQLSPLSQMSPLSPQNRNLTPSPISMGATGGNATATGGAYAEQLCNLMQGSTLQANNCTTFEVFNEYENQACDYEASVNLNAYSNSNSNSTNTNYATLNSNYMTPLRNVTSGGCIERISNNGACAPTALNHQFAAPQLSSQISEKERIERIKMDLMQTPAALMQSPLPPVITIQNGYHEIGNMNFLP